MKVTTGAAGRPRNRVLLGNVLVPTTAGRLYDLLAGQPEKGNLPNLLLGQEINVGPRALQNALAVLEGAGLVTVTYGKDSRHISIVPVAKRERYTHW